MELSGRRMVLAGKLDTSTHAEAEAQVDSLGANAGRSETAQIDLLAVSLQARSRFADAVRFASSSCSRCTGSHRMQLRVHRVAREPVSAAQSSNIIMPPGRRHLTSRRRPRPGRQLQKRCEVSPEMKRHGSRRIDATVLAPSKSRSRWSFGIGLPKQHREVRVESGS